MWEKYKNYIIAAIVIVVIVVVIYIYRYYQNYSGQPSKPPVSNEPLTIISAGYGASSCKFQDVTTRLAQQIVNNSIVVLKGSDGQFMNKLFGIDPCPNVHKILDVVYTLGNTQYRYTIPDTESIIINK